jgi:hypothetical protein
MPLAFIMTNDFAKKTRQTVDMSKNIRQNIDKTESVYADC